MTYNRSASAITPSEKCSIITNMKSTTGFPMSLKWTAYVASKPHPAARSLCYSWVTCYYLVQWISKWCITSMLAMFVVGVWMLLILLIWLWHLAGWKDVSSKCKTLSNDCLNHTCLNGATCIDGDGTYTCLCPPGYTGNIVIVIIFTIAVTLLLLLLTSLDLPLGLQPCS